VEAGEGGGLYGRPGLQVPHMRVLPLGGTRQQTLLLRGVDKQVDPHLQLIYCTVLYCFQTALYCTALNSDVLYCQVLSCPVLYVTVL